MKTTVNLYQFRKAFNDMGRGEQFSYDGLEVLFDYLEQYENDTGEEVELDVIALCCEYSEDTPQNIADLYGIELDPEEDEEEHLKQVKDFLEVETVMLGSTDSGTIVYQQF